MIETMFDTPVLFLIFNREDTTRRVFEAIRQARPTRLYVAADGPRPGRVGEVEKVQKTRAVIDGVDWPCEVKTLFREQNLGSQIAVSQAITWFFDHEGQGIILEDDCLPDPSFFPYCEELLERYKDDTRIGHISGNCFLPALIPAGQSYDFSAISHTWGWATWRRVWKNYDVTFPYWTKHRHDKHLRNKLFLNLCDRIYFSSFLSDVLSRRHGLDAWDTQYLFTVRLQHQLSIYPAVNLVTNIGLDVPDATHTTKKRHRKRFYYPSCMIEFPLKHPNNVLRNRQLDRRTIRKIFFSYKRLLRYILKDY